MSSLFFWFVYFTLDDVYKVKAVFIMDLDRTTDKRQDGGDNQNTFMVGNNLFVDLN